MHWQSVLPLAVGFSQISWENPTERAEELGIQEIMVLAEQCNNISNLFTYGFWSTGTGDTKV